MPRNDSNCAPSFYAAREALDKKIYLCDIAIGRAQATLSNLFNKRRELDEELNALSPFLRILPVHIISEIFYAATLDSLAAPDLNRPKVPTLSEYSTRLPEPFVLRQVCRAWRKIASTTTRLWGTIALRLSQRKIQGQIGLLEEWLTLSCPFVLDIYLGHTPSTTSGVEWTPPAKVFLLLLQSSNRWRSLTTPPYVGLSDALKRKRHIFPRLISLDFSVRGSGPFQQKGGLQWGFNYPPKLIQLDYGTADTQKLDINLHCLQELSGVFSPRNAASILKTCRALVKWDCTLLSEETPVMATLVRAEMSGGGYELANLKWLRISNLPDLYDLILDRLRLPNLNFLAVNKDRLGARWLYALANIVRRSSCGLTRLNLAFVDAKEEDVVRLLEHLPVLQGLRIFTAGSLFSLSDVLIQKLDPGLPCTHPPTVYCATYSRCLPHLKNLVYCGPISFTPRTLVNMTRKRVDLASSSTYSAGRALPERVVARLRIVTIHYTNKPWLSQQDPNYLQEFFRELSSLKYAGATIDLKWVS